MKEIKKYKGSLRRAVIRVLLYGLLFGCVLDFASIFLMMGNSGYLAWRLYRLFHWPAGLFLSMTVSAGIMFLTRTVVEIEEDKIHIRSFRYRESFRLEQFVSSSVSRKEHIGSFSKYTTVKCWLIFDTAEEVRRCRLYGFGERELETVLEAVRSGKAKCLTDEEKAAIIQEYEDEASEALIHGEESINEFWISSEVLIKKERKCLGRISVVTLAVAAAAGVLDAQAIFVRNTFSLQLLFLTMCVFMMICLVITLYIGLGVKKKLCAERIIIEGEHLRVGIRNYSYLGIQRIRLTSPRKRSSSVFPVQYYMYVSSEGRTDKYWLGSEVSFSYYGLFCRSLELAMVKYPDRLKYKQSISIRLDR